ncbi:OmpA family protein [Geomonas subterranea]|uniref:OmpA family protein n=1 Tax=Geomonas subterranea TaxID=2847989 RepID=UPI001CD2C849|nr:OmpA family protein [Geomonas fuzhouensis]
MTFRKVSILTVLALSVPLVSVAADLRVGLTRYEGGAAVYGVNQNQQLICDNCPSAPALVPAPQRPAIKYEPVQPAPQDEPSLVMTELPKEVGADVAEVKKPVPKGLTVFFAFDKAVLSAEEKKRIREALAAGLDPLGAVRVDGYTCRIGSESYNRKLSARRAKAVAIYLRSLGVKVATVEGLGKKHHKGAVVVKDRQAEILIKEKN